MSWTKFEPFVYRFKDIQMSMKRPGEWMTTGKRLTLNIQRPTNLNLNP